MKVNALMAYVKADQKNKYYRFTICRKMKVGEGGDRRGLLFAVTEAFDC